MQTEGSPKARIDRVDFSEEHTVFKAKFDGFAIDRSPLANGKQWA